MLLKTLTVSTVFGFLAAFLPPGQASAASPSEACPAVFGSEVSQKNTPFLAAESLTPQAYARFTKLVKDYRSGELGRVEMRSIVVNHISYQIVGNLGESAGGPNYLCKASSGKDVLVKVINDPRRNGWKNSAYYEMAATRFYLSKGFDMPKIIDFEDLGTSAYLVKEYHEGVMGEVEVFDLQLYKTEFANFGTALNREKEQLLEKLGLAHLGFRRWLYDNDIDLQEHPFQRLDDLIHYGDAKESNLLYDIKLKKWILIDP
jgi:hypothetical protein